MAGPSQNAIPGADVFPGEWPPVEHGATTVVVNDNTSRVLLVTFGEEELAPMPTFEIKRGDTWRPLEMQLLSADGSPIDLTEADAVRLKINGVTAAGNVELITGAIDWTDRAAGKVSYQWQRNEGEGLPGDLDYVGVYRAELEVEWNTGDIQTVPNNDYFTIVVFDDLTPR